MDSIWWLTTLIAELYFYTYVNVRLLGLHTLLDLLIVEFTAQIITLSMDYRI